MKIRSFIKQRKKARIEIIPMIDTMFFLLVFFMIATLSMTIMRGVPINLPKTETGKKDIKGNAAITVSKDGKLYYDKREIDLPDLRTILKRDAAGNPDMMVILNADEDTTHGKVVELIDEVKLAGITKFAIATKPKTKN
jgi:biopolymer transport protein ExbD